MMDWERLTYWIIVIGVIFLAITGLIQQVRTFNDELRYDSAYVYCSPDGSCSCNVYGDNLNYLTFCKELIHEGALWRPESITSKENQAQKVLTDEVVH